MIPEIVNSQPYIGLLVMIAGYILGLGAVTVIDIHGLLGTRSNYWTEATTRTHKVTKPLIWSGIFLATLGGSIFFSSQPPTPITDYLLTVLVALVLNGIFLTFGVSKYLLKREKEGKSSELLPAGWQQKIAVSFIISFLGWWGSLCLVIYYLVERMI